MLYAAFMGAVLIVLAALWRGSRASLPLFIATLAAVAVYLVSDMTTPLSLSF